MRQYFSPFAPLLTSASNNALEIYAPFGGVIYLVTGEGHDSSCPLFCGLNLPITHRYGFGENIDIPYDEIHDTLIRRISEIGADF